MLVGAQHNARVTAPHEFMSHESSMSYPGEESDYR